MRERKLFSVNNKTFTLIGALVLILLAGGVSIAFFNYTRTGSANTVSVGRIYFNTEEDGNINLTNAFPIKVSKDANGHITNATGYDEIEITIEGDTDYTSGIEYLVSTADTNIYTSSGKVIPISLDITVNNLGTENNNYFTERENTNASIYKKLIKDTIVGDQMVLVGFIKPNTTAGTIEGIDGSITIKAYLDDSNILISDTYDGTESDNMGTPNSMAAGKTVLTTTEWNSFVGTPLSFKIRVEANEGIWVKGSLEEIMKQENFDATKNRGILDNEQSEHVSASTGIDFGAVSSDTNGKGVYMRAGTENDAYPILYYRGAVEDNNVLFNNQCWKAVRTTDTGGVKLIYNGSASVNKAPLSVSEYTIITNTANFTFDSSDNTWTRTITGNDGSSSSPLEISFKVPARENYIMQITGTTSTSGQAHITIYKDTSSVNETGNVGGGLNFSYTYGTLTADNVIKMTYYGNGTSESPTIIKVKMVYPNETMGYGCDNSGTDAQITLSGTNTFPFSGSSLYKSLAYNGYMWGEVYEWTNAATTSGAYYGTGFTWDGTNYTLTSAKVGYDGTHHYTCNSGAAEGTCSSIRYYYYVSGTKYNFYITLTGGDSIEKAIEKMQTNRNPSNAKTQIDMWYAANMSTVTSKLEDTIWCNDRSISSKAGWDPTGNVTGNTLYYSPYDRAYNTNVPSLSCANKNDTFTVSNGNGNQKLTYPVALLTSDEITLAGGKGGSSSTFYLASGEYYWSLSPSYFRYNYANGFFVISYGDLDYLGNVNYASGLRPSVSLKPGMPVISGDGTSTSPYVIE